MHLGMCVCVRVCVCACVHSCVLHTTELWKCVGHSVFFKITLVDVSMTMFVINVVVM